MKIKEAIEIICIGREELLSIKGANGIVNLLRELEKYKAMWQTLLEDLDFMPNKEKLLMNWEDFNGLMIKIEQKYLKEELCS